MEHQMWKPIIGMSLILCTTLLATDPAPQPSVSVESCGRLRHGVVAIGGETTGTTLTCNRMVYELQLKDDAQRTFAKEHHKESVVAAGTLRKMAGTESKVRWIIDVKTLSERDETTDKEGIRLTIQGILKATDSHTKETPVMTIEAAGHVWPIDLSSDSKLLAKAKSLVGQPVQLSGSLEQDDEEESSAPAIIRVKTLERSANTPVPN
jgi:hypothetical protein